MPADSLTDGALPARLSKHFQREAHGEDVRELTAGDLAALAGGLARLADRVAATPGGRAVQVRAATGEDGRELPRALLEAVGPDMPFLVDSLLNMCSAQGLEVIALFHPVIDLAETGRLSTIQIHLPPLSEAEADELSEAAEATLNDVARAVADHQAMRAAMHAESERLGEQTHLDGDLRAESVAFLNWLASEHFVFLGKRDYRFARDGDGNVLAREPEMVEGSNLGLLRDEDLNVLNPTSEPIVLTPEIGAFLQRREPLIIAKSSLVSRVHRPVHADYVGIKHYDEAGQVNGETRFLGLFTAEAYDETARSIPLIRKRVAEIIASADAVEGGHSEKALANLLETWPRDELFQTDSETLAPMLHGALHLVGRPRVRLFIRRDEFGRFVTAIVYVPREAYDTDLRLRIGARLEAAFEGHIVDFHPRFDANPLARVHFNIALDGDAPEPDTDALEADIAAMARSWEDEFRAGLAASHLDEQTKHTALVFRDGFNAAYREAFTPREGLDDVAEIACLGDNVPVRLRAYRLDRDGPHIVRAKIYARDGSIPLSQCVPVFEHMGLFVEFETGYPVRPGRPPQYGAPETYWVHALSMQTNDASAIDLEAIRQPFQDAFVAIWRGMAENDGFNRLVLSARADWREAALIRALAAFRHQTGMDPARSTQIDALNAHGDLVRAILDLFATRFDPGLELDLDARRTRCSEIRGGIEEGLEQVAALDDDRVIRRIADLVMALQRTNFYQSGPDGSPRATVSFKLASGELDILPEPRPFREIFVDSPRVEGVHCRFGPVARGGLRWSDRRDDFRTEVLGLVKAQQVKNAVIVPVGSKGGFFPKQLPASGGREAVREAGIAAYRDFTGALLDLTDNLVDGEVVAPCDTVVWDGPDPYLVAAADKGTATFSDIANEISEAHGFWLGDAFASGGSAGYDHKKMGITARGGWEAVKRHFREMGRDIQSEPFTVIGVGDMSGDVFGNGMLLSHQTRLVAAFNHQHIFIDPDPGDPQRLWEERKRIFDLPRSSWADYDTALISNGGGVFARAMKSIPLSDEIRDLTGLTGDRVTPNVLIHALLKADADLLWFGGIGTYVKARAETHAGAGDRTNDAVRVDADALGVKVVGEGANLGLTQAARVDFSLRGGRINTDAIDNSAGVDSSDHEVNIKILATEAMRRGDLPRGERNPLLASMTEDVARHVLANNYAQTGALSLAEFRAGNDHEALERVMADLEQRGVLDRDLEILPGRAEMAERGESGRALTRPELAVIMAWTKITLFDDLVGSALPDDPAFLGTLRDYFPPAMLSYDEAMAHHRLRREIIATVLANRLVDTGGPVLALRLREATGHGSSDVVHGFEVARRLLDADTFEGQVNALDNAVPAHTQMELRCDAVSALARATEWLSVRHAGQSLDDVTALYGDLLNAFKASLRETASQHVGARIERRARELMEAGVPEPLARWSGAIGQFSQGLQLAALVRENGMEMRAASMAYYELGDRLRLDRLRTEADAALSDSAYWDRVATRRLIDDLLDQQTLATGNALGAGGVEAWLGARRAALDSLLETLRALGGGHTWSFARFALAGDAVRRFMANEL